MKLCYTTESRHPTEGRHDMDVRERRRRRIEELYERFLIAAALSEAAWEEWGTLFWGEVWDEKYLLDDFTPASLAYQRARVAGRERDQAYSELQEAYDAYVGA